MTERDRPKRGRRRTKRKTSRLAALLYRASLAEVELGLERLFTLARRSPTPPLVCLACMVPARPRHHAPWCVEAERIARDLRRRWRTSTVQARRQQEQQE